MAGLGLGIVIILAILAAIGAGLYFLFGIVGTLLGFFVAVCLFMMGIILVQKPRGGGLSGAFGGAGGSSQAVFGSRVGDVLTWVTVASFVAFLGLAVGLTYAVKPADADNAASIGTTETEGEGPSALTGEDDETVETQEQSIAVPSDMTGSGSGDGQATESSQKPASQDTP